MISSINSELLEYIAKSPSCYHAISNLKEQLKGFTELRENEAWQLVPGGKYYVVRYDSSMIAFTIPNGEITGVQMGATHCDSPVFKLKPNAEIVTDLYLKLNTEPYGGMLFAQWLDRPLSVAGRVTVRSGNKILRKLIHIDKDIAMIPGLAVHMNRDVNHGKDYNPQIDLLPMIAESNPGGFSALLAKEAGVKPEDILDTDLYLYNRMPGTVWGIDDCFISARTLDDLQCTFALMKALAESEPAEHTVQLCAVFHNEEPGSLSKQGADSTFLTDVMERICKDPETRGAIYANSFMLSADNAHATHPNYPEKADPTNSPRINGGVVIKYNANQKYTTDGVSGGIFREICRRADIPVQAYTNRSDIAGGSTLGSISGRHLSVLSVDVGVAQLSMHSPYETAGTKDTEYLFRAAKAFFASSITVCDDGYCLL